MAIGNYSVEKNAPETTMAHLEIHVSVNGDEIAFVLHAPFELDHHRFARQAVEERLGVERHERLSSGHFEWE